MCLITWTIISQHCVLSPFWSAQGILQVQNCCSQHWFNSHICYQLLSVWWVVINHISQKGSFGPFLHQFAPKMLKSGTVQTWLSERQNSFCSCLNACLWLLSHNSQALTSSIQNSQMKRNFGVLMDSSKFLVTTGRNKIKIFIVPLFIIIQIWLKSHISLSAFPAKALQCTKSNANQILSKTV